MKKSKADGTSQIGPKRTTTKKAKSTSKRGAGRAAKMKTARMSTAC